MQRAQGPGRAAPRDAYAWSWKTAPHFTPPAVALQAHQAHLARRTVRPRTSHTRLIGRRRVPLLHDVDDDDASDTVCIHNFVGVQEFALLLSGRRGVILVESVEYAVSICTLASKTAMHETDELYGCAVPWLGKGATTGAAP